jgi:predicted DNA-binding ribbon-helix-helix protein
MTIPAVRIQGVTGIYVVGMSLENDFFDSLKEKTNKEIY